MKILIVDDEALVRVGMQTIVPWQQHGYEVVGEAANGLEALELARLHKPDIVLVDIVMPEMNGIEFIQKIQAEQPECSFIILSCRNDLEYYRKAIKLGVSEYIEKSSITPGDILQAVERVSGEIRKGRVFDKSDDSGKSYVNRYLVLTEFLNQVIKGNIKDAVLIDKKLESYGVGFYGRSFHIVVFSAEMLGEGCSEYDGSFDYSVVNMCQGIINDTTGGYIFKNYNDIITAIIAKPEPDCSGDFIKSLLRRMQDTVNQCLDIVLTAGVSLELNKLEAIHEGYSQAVNSLTKKFFGNKGKIIFYDCSLEDNEILSRIEKEKDAVLNIQYPFETEGFLTAIRNITGLVTLKQGINLHHAIGVYADILYHILGLLHREKVDIRDIVGKGFNPIDYLERPKDIHQLNERMIELINKIKDFYREKFNKKGSNLISLIRKYITEHISEKITLEGISKSVHLSPTYICRFYKKETGENIQDFILKVKVEKSKELLGRGCELKDIIEMTGFSSESYFIKVFKDYTCLTPKQYMKQIGN